MLLIVGIGNTTLTQNIMTILTLKLITNGSSILIWSGTRFWAGMYVTCNGNTQVTQVGDG